MTPQMRFKVRRRPKLEIQLKHLLALQATKHGPPIRQRSTS